jgi:hypothetical protein
VFIYGHILANVVVLSKRIFQCIVNKGLIFHILS